VTNEIRELRMDELESVSGGGDDFSLTSALELSQKRMELEASATQTHAPVANQAPMASKPIRH
jgi:hypothetical protein